MNKSTARRQVALLNTSFGFAQASSKIAKRLITKNLTQKPRAKAASKVVAGFLALCGFTVAQAGHTKEGSLTWSDIRSDYGHFYHQDNLKKFGISMALAGTAANLEISHDSLKKTLDKALQDHIQKRWRNKQTDEVAKAAKLFGESRYLAPIVLLSIGTDYIKPNNGLATWGMATARAYAVGTPAMLFGQRLTGASRPVEVTRARSSQWRFFSDNNGVSGHAFAGAVPFLVLSNMSEITWLKYSAYAASFAAGFSRANDDAHYLSQVALGWYIAKLSADAVKKTNMQNTSQIMPVLSQSYIGMTYKYTW